MLTEFEKNMLSQIRTIENRQKELMKEINSILANITDLNSEGEEQNSELKLKNDEMKFLIHERISIFKELGIAPSGIFPEGIDKHFLAE